MSPPMDWLSRLLAMMTVTGELEYRCSYGAPWRTVYEDILPGDMPYHVVLKGTAILEAPGGDAPQRLGPGDIVLLPHGSTHVLHDGSGAPPLPTVERAALSRVTLSENAGGGDRLDMLCGRFRLAAPHDRLMRDYLPQRLVVRAAPAGETPPQTTAAQLAGLLGLMRAESLGEQLGGHALLNALSAALFALTLRLASEAQTPALGLLALAGQPRLAPALTAMFDDPAHPWTLPELAQRCHMSRATLARHFQDKVGRSASDLLTDLRMSLAANALKKPALSTEAVAEIVGYQSVAAFRRAFTQRTGMTPGEWRRHEGRDAAPHENSLQPI
ncbi:AraC family transcriptional regulator [Pandoraea sp.]|uniref:cupin domain-containing protein n=1 Tax=Pandoraea sp. TaxID=1883445 RepID=UPI0012000C4D|nr:AraC family transcriptional regulator [Pandoraea sp.]TAL53983.1 MAG: AraC family transcriptional regulator [Pandoraea sp.]TAM20342.1 MAG: AraC family transcriptional regulator [Pandoraea sp.]